MGYVHQYQGHGVQIAQPEEECNFGNGGIWGLEHMMMEGTQKAYPEMYYSRQPLSLATAFEEPLFSSQSQFFSNSAIPSDMATYSNESSPFMNTYTLPSAPRTPVTPATTPNMLGGQYYTATGVPFVLVPAVARDPEGNLTTVFIPRATLLDSTMDDSFTMDLSASQTAFGGDATYSMATQCTPQVQQTFDFVEDLQDDGPELVGMGLYDEPPELLYSNMSTPELAPMSTPGNGDGRGLVLEQSFGLPEDDDEDGEEYEYEDDDEDVEPQEMCY